MSWYSRGMERAKDPTIGPIRKARLGPEADAAELEST